MNGKRVELIYEQHCPNIEATRRQLLRAFRQVGKPPRWLEWEVSQPDTPAYARNYGSPTILVDGKDVTRYTQPGEAASCRIYTDQDGKLHGVPPLEDIVRALLELSTNRDTNK